MFKDKKIVKETQNFIWLVSKNIMEENIMEELNC